MAEGRMSPTESSVMGPVRVLQARVVDVDARRFTADVVTTKDGMSFPDVQIASPMWHPSGVGQKHLPPLDARCLITIPSDDTPPLITGFIDIPSPVTQADMEAEAGVDSDQANQEDARVSFAGAAAPGLPGDQQFLGMDGSFFFLRTGGVLQEGSSAFCQRFYFPLDNHIRDLAENYELITVGGDMVMESMRAEDSDDAAAGFRFRMLFNKDLEDEKSSVLIEAGKLDNNLLFRLAVAPLAIDRAQGTVDNPPFYATIDDKGSLDGRTCDWTLDIKGNQTETVDGSSSLVAKGSHSLQATDSSETLRGMKKISAPAIFLSGMINCGGNGTAMVCNAEQLLLWLTTHEHGGGPPTTSPPFIIASHIRA